MSTESSLSSDEDSLPEEICVINVNKRIWVVTFEWFTDEQIEKLYNGILPKNLEDYCHFEYYNNSRESYYLREAGHYIYHEWHIEEFEDESNVELWCRGY